VIKVEIVVVKANWNWKDGLCRLHFHGKNSHIWAKKKIFRPIYKSI